MRKSLLLVLSFCLLKISQSQIPSYIPKDSLVGWWPFNGNANDESGNGNHGTVLNGVTKSSDRYSIPNSAFRIDGLDSLNKGIIIPKKIPNNDSFTIAVWFQSTDTAKGSQAIINTDPHTVFAVGFNHPYYTQKMGSCVGTQSQWLNCGVSGINWNINDKLIWHHLVIVKDLNNIKYYLDNVLVYSYSINSSYQASAFNFILGAIQVSSGEVFKGKIDDVAIWRRTLDSSEISTLYLGCKPANHKELNNSDTLFACTSLKLSSKNKNYSSYKWSNGTTTSSTTFSSSGLVTLLEKDTNGCYNIDSVYVRLLKDEISRAPDTSICNVQANDTLKLNLNNWFGTSDYYFYNKTKSQISITDVFIKNSASKKWTGFVSLKTNTALKCPVSGNIHPSVVYPGLLSKTTDTLLTSKTALKPAIVDKKYTTYPNYLWSNGDTTWTTNFNNSGSHWFKQTDSIGCSQTDTFHFSRINLSIPSKITAKLGIKVIVRVKDSLNTASSVVWSKGDTGWYTVYTVTKNTDTIFATQTDVYRSVTKFTVVTGRAEPIKTTEEWNNSEEDSNGTNTQKTAGIEASSLNNIKVYPNPVSSEIMLEGLNRSMKYEIHNLTGQLVQSGDTSQKINVENLQTGLYILKLENVSVKFVKD